MAKCDKCNVQAQWAIVNKDEKQAYFKRMGNGFSGKGLEKVCDVHYGHLKQEELEKMILPSDTMRGVE